MLYVGGGGFHPIVVFGLPLHKQHSASLKLSYVYLRLSIQNLTPKKIHRFPGSSSDHYFFRSTPTETYKNFVFQVSFCFDFHN